MINEISANVVAAAIFKALGWIGSFLKTHPATTSHGKEVNNMSGLTELKEDRSAQAEKRSIGRNALFIFSLATDAMLISVQIITSAWGIAPFARSEFLSWTISISMFAVAGAYAMLLKGSRPQRVLSLKLLPIVILVLCLDCYTSANYFATQFNREEWAQTEISKYLQDANDRINRIALAAARELDAVDKLIGSKRDEMNLEETGFRDGHPPGRGREFARLQGEYALLDAEARQLKTRNEELRRSFNDAMKFGSGTPHPDAGAVASVRDGFNTVLRTQVPPQLATAAQVGPLDQLKETNSTSLLAMMHDIRRGDPGAIIALFIGVTLELLVVTLSAVTIGLSSKNGFPNLLEDKNAEDLERLQRRRVRESEARKQELLSASSRETLQLECKAELEKTRVAKEQEIRALKLQGLHQAKTAEEESSQIESQRLKFVEIKHKNEMQRARAELEHGRDLAQLEREKAIYEELSSAILEAETLDKIWEVSRLRGMDQDEWYGRMEKCVIAGRVMKTDSAGLRSGFCIPLSAVRKQKLDVYFLVLLDRKFVELIEVEEKRVENEDTSYYLVLSSQIFGGGPIPMAKKERPPVGKVHQFGQRK